MSALAVVGIYLVGALFTTALFRVRPPRWFVDNIHRTERDLYIARPNASDEHVTHALSRIAHFGTVLMGAIWPLLVTVILLDAPGIAWRRHRNR